jgi:hypothetical protein
MTLVAILSTGEPSATRRLAAAEALGILPT